MTETFGPRGKGERENKGKGKKLSRVGGKGRREKKGETAPLLQLFTCPRMAQTQQVRM